jgi:hypothetical protein
MRKSIWAAVAIAMLWASQAEAFCIGPEGRDVDCKSPDAFYCGEDNGGRCLCTTVATWPHYAGCVAMGVAVTGGTSGTAMIMTPSCALGYTLLSYPGTWTLVCAKDLEAPK